MHYLHKESDNRALPSSRKAATRSEQNQGAVLGRHESQDIPRDLHDVCEVIFLLRQVVVPDLIPAILDQAEYWVVTSAARASRRARFNASAAGRVYVIASLPDYLPAGSVRKIKFSTVSRDQGWSSFPVDHGSYVNSHTWFEVVLFEAEGETPSTSFTPMSIISNVHAGKEWKKHEVVWTHDSEDMRIRDVIASMTGARESRLRPMRRILAG